jgi:hypothetical protein
MTIGIGVLCSTMPKPHAPRPDAIVMLSDTMGSTDLDSTELHKMMIDEERSLFAVCADRLERCGDLFPCIQKEVDGCPQKIHGNLLDAINRAVMGHRAQHFKYDVLFPQYQLSEQSCLVPGEKLQEEWAKYDPGAAMIVGTFDNTGQALMYVIQNPGVLGASWVEPFLFPGHATIGLGGYNANFWLNYRKQHLSLSIRQSIYHAYEASRMASKAPTVNDELEIMIATKDAIIHTATGFASPPVDFPLSFETLKDLFKEKGPQNTDDLEAFAKPSVSQTSAGQQ